MNRGMVDESYHVSIEWEFNCSLQQWLSTTTVIWSFEYSNPVVMHFPSAFLMFFIQYFCLWIFSNNFALNSQFTTSMRFMTFQWENANLSILRQMEMDSFSTFYLTAIVRPLPLLPYDVSGTFGRYSFIANANKGRNSTILNAFMLLVGLK